MDELYSKCLPFFFFAFPFQIYAVRSVVPNKSNNEIVLVLQQFDFNVDKAVQAFVDGKYRRSLNLKLLELNILSSLYFFALNELNTNYSLMLNFHKHMLGI